MWEEAKKLVLTHPPKGPKACTQFTACHLVMLQQTKVVAADHYSGSVFGVTDGLQTHFRQHTLDIHVKSTEHGWFGCRHGNTGDANALQRLAEAEKQFSDIQADVSRPLATPIVGVKQPTTEGPKLHRSSLQPGTSSCHLHNVNNCFGVVPHIFPSA
jgi:hypothetical protein